MPDRRFWKELINVVLPITNLSLQTESYRRTDNTAAVPVWQTLRWFLLINTSTKLIRLINEVPLFVITIYAMSIVALLCLTADET
ncbi:hypothetical protein D918_09110 [Trichuris suis]|nr:hypothetical protein D918_09110 [Trichuris suis]